VGRWPYLSVMNAAILQRLFRSSRYPQGSTSLEYTDHRCRPDKESIGHTSPASITRPREVRPIVLVPCPPTSLCFMAPTVIVFTMRSILSTCNPRWTQAGLAILILLAPHRYALDDEWSPNTLSHYAGRSDGARFSAFSAAKTAYTKPFRLAIHLTR